MKKTYRATVSFAGKRFSAQRGKDIILDEADAAAYVDCGYLEAAVEPEAAAEPEAAVEPEVAAKKTTKTSKKKTAASA